MIFMEYLRRYIGKPVCVTLKSEMTLNGVLNNVDHFLNLKMLDAQINPQTQGFSRIGVCSIRGSAVKYITLARNEELEQRITDATFLKFSFDK